MEKTADALFIALSMKKNVLLWGPGGHAKSEVVEYGLDILLQEAGKNFYQDVFVASCSKDMDSSPFLGYDDIVEYQKNGNLRRVLTQTVYLSKQFAVLDEMLDLPDYIVAGMKEPLQRRQLCVDGTCVQNQLQSLFGCTNVDPYNWAGKDQSKLALLQRFDYIIKVEWPSYRALDFQEMFKARGLGNLHIANMIECCWKNKVEISPRSAMKMYELYTAFGLPALEHFHGMTPEMYKKLEALEVTLPYVQKFEKVRADYDKCLAETDPGLVIALAASVEAQIKGLKGIPKDAPYYEAASNMLKEVATLRLSAAEQIQNNHAKRSW